MNTRLPDLGGNAGAAFHLNHPVSDSVSIEHPEGLVTVRKGAAYVTVTLNALADVETARASAWRVVQEAFDVHAAQTRNALATSLGEREYVIWVRTGNAYDLTCVDTGDAMWMANFQLSAPTTPITPTPPTILFRHHASLCFYRLSQLTPDLFDAYRNAYLALECFVSDESPKGPSESELNWLKRVIANSFAAAIPAGLEIEQALDAIYKDGRNRVFHAKSGESFYAPQGPERQEMQALLETLTLLFVSLFQYKFGAASACRWGSMSQSIYDANARTVFRIDEIVLRHEDVAISIASEVEIFDSPRRFGQLWARVKVDRPVKLLFLKDIDLQYASKPWIQLTLVEDIPLDCVKTISVELNLHQHNVRAPKSSHPN